MSEQTDFIDACERRDLGIARARDKAERESEGWTERAARYLQEYAAHTYGQPFTIEDAREIYTGPQPKNERAWGAAVQLCARRGWLRKAGAAPTRSSNLSLKYLWTVGPMEAAFTEAVGP